MTSSSTEVDDTQQSDYALELDSLSGVDIYSSGSYSTDIPAQDTSHSNSEHIPTVVPSEETNADMAVKPYRPLLKREMSTGLIDREDLDDLKRCLETFKRNRNLLKECYGKTNKQFEDLRKVLSITDDAATKILFMSDDDQNSVKQILSKNPVILVVGQTNCGKTSLINEILQRSYLPTSEFPCTARLVRTKYSEEGYIKIKNEKGEVIQDIDIEGKFKRVPRQYIVLEGEARESKDTVEQTVEVGIDDPLLRCGVEIIDAPGMCENDALDNIVRECLDGVLQVVLYVIDGNTSLRRPVIIFKYNLPKS
jgi:ribosome biogenesis GTPase A